MQTNDFVLFPGKKDDSLAIKVSSTLGMRLSSIEFVRFKGKGILGGETKQVIMENIRGKTVYIIWSIENTNDEFVQVLQLINAAKRTGKAKEIILVMPDYPCARQDKTHAMRECISARLVADLFDKAGLDDIITIDLHSEQIEGFFKSVDHLKMTPIFADYLKKRYDKLTKKFNLKGDYHPLFDPPTINLGQIKGGEAPNIVPDRCYATLDIRYPLGMEEKDIIIQLEDLALRCEGGIEIKKRDFSVRPHLLDVNHPLVKVCKDLARSFGISLQAGTMGGITLAKNLYFRKIPAIVHSPTMQPVAHQANEYVEIKNLTICAKLWAGVIARLIGKLNER